MSKNVKPLLILIVTLIMGGVLGFLISGNVMHHKMKKFLKVHGEEGFKEIIYEAIEPTNDQKKQLIPIIDKYARRNIELQEKWRAEHKAIMDSFNTELKPIVKAEQLEKLTSWKHHPSGKQLAKSD